MANRAVHDHEGRRPARARGARVDVVGRIGHGFERSEDDGHMRGQTPRHDGVQGHFSGPDGSFSLRQVKDDVLGVETRCLQKAVQEFGRRGNHGQAVRPAFLVVRLHRLVDVRCFAHRFHGISCAEDAFYPIKQQDTAESRI